MKTHKLTNYRIAVIMISGLLTLGSLTYLATPNKAEYDALKVRASKIFSYDKVQPNALPASEVRALSLAIAFHDEQGAQKLLNRLEQFVETSKLN